MKVIVKRPNLQPEVCEDNSIEEIKEDNKKQKYNTVAEICIEDAELYEEALYHYS